MPCTWPLKCWIGPELEKGKVNVVFRRKDSLRGEEIYLPCGSCLDCRLEYSRQWAVRCMHEASLHEDNCFVTLTYDENNLPDNLSLDVREWQTFMKRLRRKYGKGIKYFHCGEYGEKLGRPHYHGLLFNHDFKDKVLYAEKDGDRLYTSASLSELWPKGFSTVGAVTFKSAGYVARYNMKKVRKRDVDEIDSNGMKNYERACMETGEVWSVKPEYATMSRRPGIGKGWFDKFKSDVFPSDEVVINGKITRPPRYYENLLKNVDKEMFDNLKLERKINGTKLVDVGSRPDGSRILVNDFSDPWRCETRETCTKKKVEMLIRPMEEEI